MYDIQRASMLKRISAFLLDFILMMIAVTGFAFLLSLVTGFDGHNAELAAKQSEYETLYGVDFDIDPADYEKLTEDEQKKINDAYEQFAKDKDVIKSYNMIFNLTLLITTLSIFLAFMLLEFVIPLIFKNGQTVGKKVFALGVVHTNAVRLTHVALFARTLLGKYTIETMVPVIIVIMMLFGSGGMTGLIVLGLILVLQLFVFFKDKLCTPIHDVLSHTVCVDLSTQMIFENADELIKYKEALHKEAADRADYF
ncbi:MAG: RDD family protein [Clostridia bacterium]|nr:RDD family protein [Clostridia bacterium]